MRNLPRSSVTTTLANFVGRSVVSAMTHTPASGPFELVTTPPISVLPTWTADAGARCALRPDPAPVRHKAIPAMTAICTCKLFFIRFLLVRNSQPVTKSTVAAVYFLRLRAIALALRGAPLQQAHRQFILERSSEKIPISAEAQCDMWAGVARKS